MSYTIFVDTSSLMQELDDFTQDQAPFALALTLTRLAIESKKMEEHEMLDVFDRPTPFAIRGVRYKMAKKDDLEASVYLDDFAGKGTPAEKFLAPQVFGGGRNLKRFELALRAKGVLPSNMFVVPGAAAKLDAYGNMERSQIVQILSYFAAFGEQGYRANITQARKEKLARGTKKRVGFAYFVGRPGGRPLGVWQRVHLAHGSAVKPILIFVERARHEAIFDFEFVAETTVEKNAELFFEESLRDAILSARPAPL